MFKSLLFCALFGYTYANYYIVDVLKYDDYMIYHGILRYPTSNSLNDYGECKGSTSLMIRKGQLGWKESCAGIHPAMGFYFPSGYNGTITEAYDWSNKIFYPCVEISQGDAITYGCGNILMSPIVTDETEADAVTATTATVTATKVANAVAVEATTTRTTEDSTTRRTTTTFTTKTTTRATTTTNSNQPTASCVKSSSVYGKKDGNGKPGQCCTSSDDCKESCRNGVCGTCDVHFEC